MIKEGNYLMPKNADNFYCEFCDFKCSKQSNFNNHLLTLKHIKRYKNGKNDNKKMPKNATPKCVCQCGKTYSFPSGLSRHQKKCQPNNEIMIEQQKELVNYLMKENAEFKQFMIEQNKQMVEIVKNSTNIHNTIIGTNNTNNTNSFNINFFLNETCKNAMNIMDFVNQLKIDNNDLEETSRLGFAEGISKIFINGLKNIDINDRPLHCSNIKKETLYIKDGGEWNKETNDKAILTNAIKSVAHKNIRQITEWTKEHPEFNNCASKQNDKYLKIVSESMCGLTKEDTIKNYSRIIKNIIKETVIDKIK
jgi:hypothetical protein